MLEIRIHGRGGQGAVIASKILALAIFREGKFVQAFPSFGVERRGAPVAAFVRVDNKPVLLRSQVRAPDHLIVLDPGLMHTVDVTAGLREGGWIVVNSPLTPAELGFSDRFQVATVDASGIALRHQLGTAQAPIVNTAILGAYARSTGEVRLDSVLAAISETLKCDPSSNLAATRDAHDSPQAIQRGVPAA